MQKLADYCTARQADAKLILVQQTSVNEVVGRNVRALRGKMSQEELAEKLAERLGKEKIHGTSITRLERGSRTITVDELVALSRIFGVSVAVLLQPSESNASRLASVREASRLLDQAEEALVTAAKRWRSRRAALRTLAEVTDSSMMDFFDWELLTWKSKQTLREVLKDFDDSAS